MLPNVLGIINLNVGESKNYHHVGCNNRRTSRSMSIKRNKYGYIYHCFKCGESGLHRDVYFQGLSGTKTGSGSGNIPKHSCWPPDRNDVSSGLSAQVRDYLGRYKLDPSELVDEILEFHDSTRRSIGLRTARGYVERTLDGPGPKWLSHGASGDFYLRGRGDILVLTEDWISARLVSEHTAAMATLGTQVHDSHLPVIRKFPYVAVWYDDDSSIVRKQQLAACVKVQAYVPCTVIHTGTDPKNIPDKIPEVLRGIRDHFGL